MEKKRERLRERRFDDCPLLRTSPGLSPLGSVTECAVANLNPRASTSSRCHGLVPLKKQPIICRLLQIAISRADVVRASHFSISPFRQHTPAKRGHHGHGQGCFYKRGSTRKFNMVMNIAVSVGFPAGKSCNCW